MTYEQRRAELAEKMARKHFEGKEPSADTIRKFTAHYMSIAELALAEMANSVKNAMLYVYASGVEISQYLIDNGLVPQTNDND